MGRTQRPLEADTATARFAGRLRDARRRSGLTLRELSKITGYSASTLSMAEAGRRLPSWDVVAAFAQGCKDGDLAHWRGWWEAASAAAVPSSPVAGSSAGAASSTAAPATAGVPATAVVPAQPGAPGEAAARETPPGPETVAEPRPVVARTRWWPVLVAAVASSALTATVLLLHPFGLNALAAAEPLAVAQAGTDPAPESNCGVGRPGYGCHLKDPNATGCADDAVLASVSVLSYEGRQAVKLENWHSNRCGTTWAQLRVPNGWQGRVEAATQTGRTCFPTNCQDLFTGTPPYWTDMLFGLNQPTSAIAYVKLPNGEVKKMQTDAAAGASAR